MRKFSTKSTKLKVFPLKLENLILIVKEFSFLKKIDSMKNPCMGKLHVVFGKTAVRKWEMKSEKLIYLCCFHAFLFHRIVYICFSLIYSIDFLSSFSNPHTHTHTLHHLSLSLSYGILLLYFYDLMSQHKHMNMLLDNKHFNVVSIDLRKIHSIKRTI